MNPASYSIEDIERALDEGRLGDIESIPPYVGPLPTTPRLRPSGGLVVEFPNEIQRHAKAWTRVKRALRDAEWPNPYRVHREIKPDPEFLARNVTFLVFRQLGIKCGFQWLVSNTFHRHFVVFPTRGGQASQLAREHIHRADRNIWSLAIYPLWDIRQNLTVAEAQLWRNARDPEHGNSPWRAHAAVVSTSVITDHPHCCLSLNGWASIEALALGKTVEHDYDYMNSQGRAKIGKLPCRQAPRACFRPMIELLPLLDGWNLARLKSENRIDVSGGIARRKV